MSERRSYDWMTGTGYPTNEDRRMAHEHPNASTRSLLWRDDWPPQSEVPHAGERVWSRSGQEGVVQSGIPYRSHVSRKWAVNVTMTDPDRTCTFYLDQLSRTPPTKRYRVSVGDCLTWNGREHIIEAESEADAIAKAVRVEEVES